LFCSVAVLDNKSVRVSTSILLSCHHFVVAYSQRTHVYCSHKPCES